MTYSYLFDAEARVATVRLFDRLKDLQSVTARLIPSGSDDSNFLAFVGHKFKSAMAIKSWAVVFFADKLLISAPNPISQAVAIHEAVHLRLGSEIRNGLCQGHPDIVQLLHKAIIPYWLEGKLEIHSDENYILHKKWRMLYDKWWDPSKIQAQKAKDAINRYFDLLKQGRIFFLDGELVSIFRPSATPHPKSVFTVEDLIESNLQEMATKVVTGYELLEYLTECMESALRMEMTIDLATLEEGFATYISSNLTGISLSEIQRWAPQDPGKVELARRIEANCPSIERAIQSTETYSNLISFSRELGILNPV